MTYSLASGDLEDLGWESDGALQAKLLVFGTVDEVIRDCITYIRMISTSPHGTQDTKQEQEGDEHFSRFLTLLLVRVMRILWSLAVGTEPTASYSFSP